MIEAVSAFLIGGLWAVTLAGYDVLRDGIPDISPVKRLPFSARPVADSIIVGGGSGATLWLVHWQLSAVEFGAAGYLLVGGFLFFRLYWPLSESEDEPSSSDQ